MDASRPIVDEQEAIRDWHRLFGLLLMDCFAGTPFTVEIERDLSQQQQLLDVVILRKGPGPIAITLPDGLDGFASHNLITFKSIRETLDAWAMKELIGHYVAYRKLVSPKPSELLAEDGFCLFALSARYPQALFSQIPWRRERPGVYDCEWGTDRIRVIAASELPKSANNAPLHLFSASDELFRFGQSQFRIRSPHASKMLGSLAVKVGEEGYTMAFTTIEELETEIVRSKLRFIPKELLLQEVSIEDRLKSVPIEQRLKSVPLQDRVKDMLANYSPEEIRAMLPPSGDGSKSSKPKSKKTRRKQ